MAIRAVLCDLGGVVIRIDPDRIRSAWARLSTLPSEAVHAGYPDAVHDSFERDELTEEEYLDHVRSKLSLRGTDQQIRDAFNDLYLGVDEDTVGVLRRLRERGLCLFALTNTNRMHHRVWSQRFATALDTFHEIYCSHDLGCRKPEPEVFRRVLDAHALDPHEAVFVDDVQEHVDAAGSAGLTAVLFTDASTLKRDFDSLEWAGNGACEGSPEGHPPT